MGDINFAVAFLAGIISFFSPCILPVLPGFMAFLSGGTRSAPASRRESFLSSVFFVLGFSLVFAALGVLLNTVLSSSSYDVRVWLGRIGGTVIILFALYILGLLKIPFLMREHKLQVKRYKSRYLTATVFGAAFAFGWSPCVGAILGSIFALAISSPGSSFILLMSYALGLGLPFLLVGLFTEQAMLWIRKSSSLLKYFNLVVGILLLILGILVFTDQLTYVAYFLTPSILVN